MKKYILLFLLLPVLFATIMSFEAKKAYENNESDHKDSYLAIGQSDPDEDRVDDLRDEISKLEKKIRDLQGKERSLQNEISSLTNEISLIQLKIQESNKNIASAEADLQELGVDIGNLSVKIVDLQDAVFYQTALLNERIRARYKTDHSISPIEIILSGNVTEIIQKVRYLRAVEEQDAKLISQLSDTKKNYEGQKLSLEEKKIKVEELKLKIERDKANQVSLKSSLDNQKREKDALLSQTEGQEAKYQNLLSQAKAELEAIEGAVSAINFENGEEVDEGDVIAHMGNSGAPVCSTAPHLHFEVRKNGAVTNSERYLRPKNVFVYHYTSGFMTIGSGEWEWPMRSPTITQRYGRTPWSWRYSPPSHTGIDMVATNQNIYAPEDGTYIRGSIGCYGSTMNFAAIRHSDSVISYYFHIR